MNLRTTTRLSACAGIACLFAGLLAFVAQPASALEKERIVIGEGESFTGSFGPLASPNPVTQVSNTLGLTVEICSSAPYCDAIPMTIKPPVSFDEADGEYFVYVEVSWPTVVVPNAPALGDFSVNDIDAYIVNDPFVEDAGPDEDGFAYRMASASHPEYTTMYKPAGDWYLLVNNYTAGPIPEYEVLVEWRTRLFPPTPLESLPPEFSAAPKAKPSLAAPPATFATPPAVFDVPEPAAPSIEPSRPPIADGTFDTGFDDEGGLSDQLAAPPTTVIDFRPAGIDDDASTPSGLSLLLWLLALPLLLMALFGWYLQRRRETLAI